MISLLVQLLVLLIVFALVWWIFTLLPLPPPIKQVANVVIVAIFCLILIFYVLLPLAGVGGRHLGWR